MPSQILCGDLHQPELRSSYELAYHTSNTVKDGTFRKIVIRAKCPGLTVRAKTGYHAR